MSQNLSDLLEKKSFDELGREERQFVLNQMSEEAYISQRESLLAAQSFLAAERDTMTPNPEIPVLALEALQAKKARKKRRLFFIWEHRTPTWAAAAACLIILLVSKGFSYFNAEHLENIPVSENVADTVYVEKLVTKHEKIYLPSDTVIKVVYHENKDIPVAVEKVNPPQLNPTEQILVFSDEMLNASHLNINTLIENHSKPKGVSIKNDSISKLVSESVY